MKKTILFICLVFAGSLYAMEKAQCEELFRAAIHNFYLENSCKFDKHISSTIRKEFENHNCTKFFTDEDMKNLNSEVLGDSYQKMNKVGRDDFCINNKALYDAMQKKQ